MTFSNGTVVNTCSPSVNYQQYLHFSLIPALFIIALLSLFTKRVNNHDCWGGVPGLLIPINFFCVQKKRLAIALAFGATAGSILPLLSGFNIFIEDGKELNPWETSFVKLLGIVELGIIYYPIMACLTFPGEERLLTSLLGFLYTIPRFAVQLNQALDCPNGTEPSAQVLIPYYAFLLEFPVIFCLFFISMDFLVTFLMALYVHFNTRMSQPSEFRNLPTVSFPSEEEPIAGKHDYRHVLTIMNKSYRVNPKPWYAYIVEIFYYPRADFKFSVQVVATLVVAVIMVFQLEIELLVNGSELLKLGKLIAENKLGGKTYKIVGDFLKYFGMSCVIASLVISVYILILILSFLSRHRENMLQMWKGNRKFLPESIPSPASMVRLSLRYSGYQLSYIFWGLFVMHLITLLIATIVCAGIVFWPYLETEIKEKIFTFFLSILPYFVFFLIVWLIQFILSWVFFRDYSFPNITININNPRIYHITNFLFFFYGALLGVWVSLFRIFKAMFLGIILLPRIDRNSLMEGYHFLDSGYMAYLGYLHVSASHHNPVLLVFCQFLIDEKKKKAIKASVSPFLPIQEPSISYGTLEEQTNDTQEERPRFSKKGLNRWFLAVQLIKIPGLIQYRRYVQYPELVGHLTTNM